MIIQRQLPAYASNISPAKPLLSEEKENRRNENDLISTSLSSFRIMNAASALQELRLSSLAIPKLPASVTSDHDIGHAGPFPNEEDERILAIKRARFYKSSYAREILWWFGVICTGGLMHFFLDWFPNFKARMRYIKVSCDDPDAELAVIQAADGTIETVRIFFLRNVDYPVRDSTSGDNSMAVISDGWEPQKKIKKQKQTKRTENGRYLNANGICMSSTLLGVDGGSAPLRMFYWRYEKFFALPGIEGWTRISFGLSQRHLTELHKIAVDQLNHTLRIGPIRSDTIKKRTFGLNAVDIRVESLGSILLTEITTPFFFFQVFSTVTWIVEGYTTYAVVIIFITAISLLQIKNWWTALKVIQSTPLKREAFMVKSNQKSLQKIAGTQVPVERAILKPLNEFSTSSATRIEYESLMSGQLTPGDVIRIKTGDHAACDFVLLTGQLVVSEAMLTGESAPVVKYPLPLTNPVNSLSVKFDSNKHSKHVILSGTLVLQAKSPGHPPIGYDDPMKQSIWPIICSGDDPNIFEDGTVLAMVVATGASTAKGKLIRAIKHPQTKTGHADEQTRDSMTFLAVLFVIVIVFILWYAIYASFTQSEPASEVIIRCLDMITIMVPAALPLALTIGVSAALGRLTKKGIFCIAPDHVVSAGYVDTICYDKTGTLTREGDTLVGVMPSSAITLQDSGNVPNIDNWGLTKDARGGLLKVMAACHNLEPLETSNELVGESLELEMFKASGWQQIQRPHRENMRTSLFESVLKSSGVSNSVPLSVQSILVPMQADDLQEHYPLAVIHLFPFDADTRLMSVLTMPLYPRSHHKSDKEVPDLLLATKGAPEGVFRVCNPRTLPLGFKSRLDDMTGEGYRILACATKTIEGVDTTTAMNIPQSHFESDMDFAGFLVMGNQLKNETSAVLQEVTVAGLRQCMITGDNMLTAVSVARQNKNSNLWQETKPAIYIDLNTESETDGASSCSVTISSNTNATIRNVDMHADLPKSLAAALRSGGSFSLDYFNIALSGAAFSALYEEHMMLNQGKEDWPKDTYDPNFKLSNATPLVQVMKYTHVYARVAPREKQLVVKCLQNLGHVVCMVGDGANDSFALKTADAGLSIAGHEMDPLEHSEMLTTPSIAAPFSTRISNITAVPLLLREGRAALATSMVSFRYMFQYGITQFFATCILYIHLSTFSGGQFLMGDLVNTLPLIVALNFTDAPKTLKPGLPYTKLISWNFILALVGHCVILCFSQLAQFFFLTIQPWYIPLTSIEGANDSSSQERTILFLSSNFMYLTSAIALSHSYGGFRGQTLTNHMLVFTVVFLFTLDSALFLYPGVLADWFDIVQGIPLWFMFVSWLWALVTGFVLVVFELGVVTKTQEFWFDRQRMNRNCIASNGITSNRSSYNIV